MDNRNYHSVFKSNPLEKNSYISTYDLIKQIPTLNESMLQRFIETISCKNIIIENKIIRYSSGYIYCEKSTKLSFIFK